MNRLILLLVFIAATILSGCSPADARYAVMSKYPGCTITNLPGSGNVFILRKPDGAVWYATCRGENRLPTCVWNDVEIIPPFSPPTSTTPQSTLP